jgi:pyruvate-formate lyase-activating enzyme
MIIEKGYHLIAICKTCGASYWMDMIEHFKETGHIYYDVKVTKDYVLMDRIVEAQNKGKKKIDE